MILFCIIKQFLLICAWHFSFNRVKLYTKLLGVKWPGREADHSPPTSVDVKNAWSYTSTPQYVFMAWCLVKHRDNFTFTLLLLYFILWRAGTSAQNLHSHYSGSHWDVGKLRDEGKGREARSHRHRVTLWGDIVITRDASTHHDRCLNPTTLLEDLPLNIRDKCATSR
jgi:hypothetical protein